MPDQVIANQAVRAGTLADLQKTGQLLTKVGTVPVVVFWHDDAPYAIEDRCPHLGFPLHQGTVESGLVTCHWHHARFDLVSGCTLDMWADDARGFAASIRDGDVFVGARADPDPVGHLQARLRNGLEENITLVIAKSVLGLLDEGVPAAEIVRTGLDFGTTYRGAGWGAGLTVLVAMANLFPHLHPDDRALALVHGLAFVADDTSGQAPRFPVGPLATHDVPVVRLEGWYRRFVDTRSSDSAERTLETALVDPARLGAVESMMFAAVSDHVFIDGGHTIDFTNKAFEALALVGTDAAGQVLPTLVQQTARAQRSEEFSEWQHPTDLVAFVRETSARMEGPNVPAVEPLDIAALSWRMLSDNPYGVSDAFIEAWSAGATDEELGRAVAYAAALRIVRFHTRNDHADWDTVHHSFTAANALHQALSRNPTPELRRAAVQATLPHLSRPVPQRSRGAIAARDDRQHRRAEPVLRSAGDGRRSRQRGIRLPHHGWLTRGGDRRARSGPARRGRGVPLVPDGRSRGTPGDRLARRIRGVDADPGRHRALPRRPYADAPRATDRRADCVPSTPRRSALRGRRRVSRCGFRHDRSLSVGDTSWFSQIGL